MADDSNQDPKGNKANDSWRRIKGLMGDGKTGGDQAAKGQVDLATGTETDPCFMCKSWEKNERKLAQHFRAHGLTIEPDGTVETPIIKGDPNRTTMKLKIQHMGWCRQECMPTDDLATCQKFNQVKRREEMRDRMSLVDRVRE